ncbi:MAG: pyridoxamine 5'-phosphate oxidase family protein [Lachnospiraceae bacterium]|nr:pyridoxamine 5'-phosphate oxidase family protein [Lachnospiraceae bacterium]
MMIRTLLLYDGKMNSAERIAGQLGSMIGHAMEAEIEDAPEDITPYGGLCFVFNFYGAVTAGKTTKYIIDHAEELRGRKLVMVGLGFSEQGFTRYVTDTERESGLTDIAGVFITGQSQITRVGNEIESIMRSGSNSMEEDALYGKIRSYIAEHETLVLAAAGEGYVRCAPLRYIYLDEQFYILTEGGSEFRGVLDNGRVGAVIYDASSGSTGEMLSGLSIRGDASFVQFGTEEYMTAIKAAGVDGDELSGYPVRLYLIRIRPRHFEYTDRSMEAEGYDATQAMETRFALENRRDGKEYIRRESLRGQPHSFILDDRGERREVQIPVVGDPVSAFMTESGTFDFRLPEDKEAAERKERKKAEEKDLSDAEQAAPRDDEAGAAEADGPEKMTREEIEELLTETENKRQTDPVRLLEDEIERDYGEERPERPARRRRTGRNRRRTENGEDFSEMFSDDEESTAAEEKKQRKAVKEKKSGGILAGIRGGIGKLFIIEEDDEEE